MPKGDFTKTKEFIIPLRGVVRDGQLAALLDQSGQEIGMPVTAVESVTGRIGFSAGGAESALPLLSSAQTDIILGDSITAQNFLTDANSPTSRMTDYGYAAWCGAYSAGRLNVIYNAGIAGETAEQIAARVVVDVIARAPGRVHVMAGINSVIAGVPLETIQASLRSIYTACLNAGIYVIAYTVLPLAAGHAAYSAANQQKIIALNRWIVDTANASDGMAVVDAFAVVVDPLSTTAQPLAGMLKTDNIHPTGKGARAIGAVAGAALARMSPPPNILVSSAADTVAVSSGSNNIIDNPLLTGSGGTAGAGATGTIPQKWVVGRVSGSGAVSACTVAARTVANDGDAIGNNLHVVMTDGVSGDIVEVKTDSVHARIVAGTTVRASAVARWTGMTAVGRTQALFVMVIDGVTYYSETMAFSDTTMDQSDWPTQMVIHTPPFVVPDGACTSARLFFYTRFNGAGGATLDVARVAVRQTA